MSGPYNGAVVFGLPDPRSMAAVSPAVTSPGALSRLEAHELFKSSNLTGSPDEPRGSPAGRQVPDRRGGLPAGGH